MCLRLLEHRCGSGFIPPTPRVRGTAATACPIGKVANITGEFACIGVRLRSCGQGLRCRSPWFGAEVDGVGFMRPCTQAQGRGSDVHRDMVPVIGCIHYGIWTDTCHKSHGSTTTSTTTTKSTTTTTTTTQTRPVKGALSVRALSLVLFSGRHGR